MLLKNLGKECNFRTKEHSSIMNDKETSEIKALFTEKLRLMKIFTQIQC